MAENDSIQDWLRRARADLRMARLGLNEGLTESAAFHIQQAAEKALKAGVALAGEDPPKTHNLRRLEAASAVKSGWSDLALGVRTQWVVAGRYAPDEPVPLDAETLETALEETAILVEKVADETA